MLSNGEHSEIEDHKLSLVNEVKRSSKYETLVLHFSLSLCLSCVNIGLYTVHEPLANQPTGEIRIVMRMFF